MLSLHDALPILGQRRTMLGEVNEIANGSLPQNLVAANDVAAQTRAALADAQAEIAEVDARLMQLRSAADAMRDVSRASLGALHRGVARAHTGPAAGRDSSLRAVEISVGTFWCTQPYHKHNKK